MATCCYYLGCASIIFSLFCGLFSLDLLSKASKQVTKQKFFNRAVNTMKLKPLVLGLVFLALSKAQVDIHEKSKDGYIRVPINETAGTSEIYTSMYQLEKFFEEEKAYVEDLKLMIEKKLVTQQAVSGNP